MRVGFLGRSRNALAVVFGLRGHDNTGSVSYSLQPALKLRPRAGLLALPDPEVYLKVLSYLQLSGKAADVNVADNRGYTPLIIASMCNNVSIVRLLVDAGADKDAVCLCNAFRLTALDMALRAGHTEIIQLLSG